MANVVYFLGAGFSAPFGLPVMRSFFEIANNSPRLDSHDKSFLRDLRREARSANSFLASDHDNLEDILSFALMQDAIGVHTHSQGGNIGKRLQKILGAVYSAPDISQVRQNAKRFRGFLEERDSAKDHHITVVTTNYDLVVDWALISSGFGIKYPVEFNRAEFQPAARGGYLDHSKKRQVLVCKLHGSANWHATEDRGLVVDDRLENFSTHDRSINEHYPKSWSVNFQYESPPLIVPPSYTKPEIGDLMKQTWAAAGAALSKADVVVVIGYSFPLSDLYMQLFFAASLTPAIDCRQFWIVDPNASQIQERLGQSTSKVGNHWKQLIRPQNMPWTVVADGALRNFLR